MCLKFGSSVNRFLLGQNCLAHFIHDVLRHANAKNISLSKIKCRVTNKLNQFNFGQFELDPFDFNLFVLCPFNTN